MAHERNRRYDDCAPEACDDQNAGQTKADPAAKEDPWIHRSYRMLCHKCMYYVRKLPDPNSAMISVEIGRCRRHAPTMSGFPVMYPHDWCGDHKLDENK